MSITVKVLMELRKLNTREGTTILMIFTTTIITLPILKWLYSR